MPDITMCRNALCEEKEKCYRWTATPSNWQSYASFEGPKEGEKCKHFWLDEKHETRKKN